MMWMVDGRRGSFRNDGQDHNTRRIDSRCDARSQLVRHPPLAAPRLSPLRLRSPLMGAGEARDVFSFPTFPESCGRRRIEEGSCKSQTMKPQTISISVTSADLRARHLGPVGRQSLHRMGGKTHAKVRTVPYRTVRTVRVLRSMHRNIRRRAGAGRAEACAQGQGSPVPPSLFYTLRKVEAW